MIHFYRALLITAIAVLAMFLCGEANAQDTWSGRDKRQHFAISFAAGVGCSQVFQGATAYGCAILPGLVKELSDSQEEGNKFSGKDMVANALGAYLGVRTGRWLIMRHNSQTIVAYRVQFD